MAENMFVKGSSVTPESCPEMQEDIKCELVERSSLSPSENRVCDMHKVWIKEESSMKEEPLTSDVKEGTAGTAENDCLHCDDRGDSVTTLWNSCNQNMQDSGRILKMEEPETRSECSWNLAEEHDKKLSDYALDNAGFSSIVPNFQQRPCTDERSVWCRVYSAKLRDSPASVAQTAKKTYSCAFCTSTFGAKCHLITHIRVHTGEKPFACTVCPAKFAHSSGLWQHIRTHSVEKLFACTACSAKFRSSSGLRNHRLVHTGEKRFLCAVCSFRSSHGSSFKEHMRIHTGEKPYACGECSAKFSRSSSLKMHVRRHTGEKPYSCAVCSTTFRKRNHLITHIRSHSGERPFSCTTCSARFIRSTDVKRHMHIHTGEKPFACAVCSARFAIKSNLIKHLRVHAN